MSKTHLASTALAILFSFTAVSANAALVGVLPATPGGTDYQAYYDDVADVTWLANANAGAGSSFDDGASTTDGLMSWTNASNWAASLNINGVTGWRLPFTDETCGVNFNCTDSEMGNLFYIVLGGTAGDPISVTNNSNYGLFSNVQDFAYWSATELPPPANEAWFFNFVNGKQNSAPESNVNFAWAVLTGGSHLVVPVPAAVWLFGSGLLGLIGIARRRKAA